MSTAKYTYKLTWPVLRLPENDVMNQKLFSAAKVTASEAATLVQSMRRSGLLSFPGGIEAPAPVEKLPTWSEERARSLGITREEFLKRWQPRHNELRRAKAR